MRSQFVREPLAGDPQRSRRALTLHRFLMRGALAGGHIFAWIFAFEFFYALEASIDHAFVRTILLYALSQTVTCLVTPLAARSLLFGAGRVLMLAVPLAAVAFVLLGATFDGWFSGISASYSMIAFALAMGLYRALYWTPYDVEFSAHARTSGSIFPELLIALMPLIGGLLVVSVRNGPAALSYWGAVIIIGSVIPLFFVRDIRERFTWGYRETFRRLLSINDRHIAVGSFLDGISGAVLLLFWPFAIFLIVGNSHGTLGLVLSLTFCVAILMRKFVRTVLGRLRVERSLLVHTVFAVTPWLFRFFVASPVGVIFVDSYFYSTTSRRAGVDAVAYEQAADGGSYVDEYTALKEVALALGKITICLAAAAILSFASVPIVLGFALLAAAIASTAGVFWHR